MNSRQIAYKDIAEAVRLLCIDSCYLLGDDVYKALKIASAADSKPMARNILSLLTENALIARDEHIPICQDTGLAVVFVEQGANVEIVPPAGNSEATICDAVNEGVAAGYDQGLLRKSVVAEPLFERENTRTNTPAIIHYSIVRGDKLKISVMTKGGGCENKSLFKAFNPTATPEDIAGWVLDVVKEAGANACPPFVVGVGIGGNFELSALLSKKALLRPLADEHPDERYAGFERMVLELVNQSGVGPQGFGGDTTALAVKVEHAPCHIASLPVSVNMECHAHRHKSVVL
ncbi:MAG: fumarate hydratase [Phycisphaerae bacterium]|jgi:fumarate hydratase subunit alpha